MSAQAICDIRSRVGEQVLLEGWVENFRSSGKVFFLQLRDGTGFVQVVYSKAQLSEGEWQTLTEAALEQAVRVEGTVAEDARSPFGVEVQGSAFARVGEAVNYPIAKKEHGTDFLLDHRHLWLRSRRQWAIMRVRDTIERATMDYLHQERFVRIDAPILTPNSCEDTTELFEIDYFGRPAYLSQSGQLYIEAAMFGHKRVYDFGPVFRAEKSKTRRHLNEFWMMDAEMAFCDWQQNMDMQEGLIRFIVNRVLEECVFELNILERDVSKLEAVRKPFVRLSHKEAVRILREKGSDIEEGDDLGADDETTLTSLYDVPVFVTQYPAAVKAFYMKPDPSDPSRVLCADLLAPEGYGEIIGGSEREVDLERLTKKIEEHHLPMEQFQWYLDLRRFGSVPHSGFGYGLERLVTWICGMKHIRTAIPFPRTISRLEP